MADFCIQQKLCGLTLVFGFKRHHPHMSALVNLARELDCSDFNFDSQLILKFSLDSITDHLPTDKKVESMRQDKL